MKNPEPLSLYPHTLRRFLFAIVLSCGFANVGHARIVIQSTVVDAAAGAIHTMRYGQSDDETADSIPRRFQDPWCFTMGSTPRVTVVLADDGTTTGLSGLTGFPMGWRLSGLYIDPRPDVNPGIIANFDTGIQLYPVVTNGLCATLPAHVGWWWGFRKIDLYYYDFLTDEWVFDGSWKLPSGQPIFTTLGAPAEPMAKPWLGVLGFACWWGRGETEANSATVKLTEELYGYGLYQPSASGFTRPVVRAGANPDLELLFKEYFYLRAFLNDPQCPWGQCTDFADFLVCMSNSVGAVGLVAIRTRPEALPSGVQFNTSPLHPAYRGACPEPSSFPFVFHSFAKSSALAWDGTHSYPSAGPTTGLSILTVFQPRLVQSWVPPWSGWSLFPNSGLTLNCVTGPVPSEAFVVE